jgi:hypothetical protein
MTNKTEIGKIQNTFKQKVERILQCNSCQTNLFHLVKLGNKQIVECSGCGHKSEMKK